MPKNKTSCEFSVSFIYILISTRSATPNSDTYLLKYWKYKYDLLSTPTHTL